jgi:DNA replication protein DnaC
MVYSVRYFHTSHLLHTLEQTRQEAYYLAPLLSLARTGLLILDDWMRDPPSQTNTQNIFEVLDNTASGIPPRRLSHRYLLLNSLHRSSTLADAILGRLIHTAYRINMVERARISFVP